MTEALFTAEQFAASGLADTALFRDLRAAPIGLVDIGARWGVSDIFAVTASVFDVMAFEPDPDEAQRLMETATKGAPWARLTILPYALAETQRNIELHLLRRANNSSIFPVDPQKYLRYRLLGFELEKTLELPARALDDLVFEDSSGPHAGEILKIDTQGAERLILEGSQRTLAERTLCIICEASFFTAYQGAPLFSEVELFVRQQGFSFYGFLDLQQRSTRRLDKRRTRGRERHMQADAIFFRDPFERGAGHRAARRSVEVLVLVATLFGFYDFALELTNLLGDQPVLADAIHRLASLSVSSVTAQVEALLEKIRQHPEDATVLLGKLIDLHRDFHTYHDVSLSS